MQYAPRFGLVGVGRWGRNIAACLMHSQFARLVSMASRNPAVIESFEGRCDVFPSWKTLIEKGPALDGLIIASPPDTHTMIALDAIHNGIPVLIEKPLATSIIDAEAVRAECEERGVAVMVDFMHLFSPGWRWLRSQLPKVGLLQELWSVSGNLGPFRKDVTPLWDWAAHDLAMVLALAGREIAGIHARRKAIEDTRDGIGEVVGIKLMYPGGLEADIECGNILAAKRREFRAVGADGEIRYDDVAKTGELITDKRRTTVDFGQLDESPLENVLRTFALVCQGTGQDQDDTLRLGLDTTRLIAAIESRIGLSETSDWQTVPYQRQA